MSAISILFLFAVPVVCLCCVCFVFFLVIVRPPTLIRSAPLCRSRMREAGRDTSQGTNAPLLLFLNDMLGRPDPELLARLRAEADAQLERTSAALADQLNTLDRTLAFWQDVVAQLQQQFGDVAFEGSACTQHEIAGFAGATCPACRVKVHEACQANWGPIVKFLDAQTPLGLHAQTLQALEHMPASFRFVEADLSIEPRVRTKCFTTLEYAQIMAKVDAAQAIGDAGTRARMLLQCLHRCEEALHTNPSHADMKRLKADLELEDSAAKGRTYAHVAALQGDLNRLQALAVTERQAGRADGGQLRWPDLDGFIPLHLASFTVTADHKACLDWLLEVCKDMESVRAITGCRPRSANSVFDFPRPIRV